MTTALDLIAALRAQRDEAIRRYDFEVEKNDQLATELEAIREALEDALNVSSVAQHEQTHEVIVGTDEPVPEQVDASIPWEDA